MLHESGTPKACAIEGRAMFTMDESSVVMNAADPDSASTTHLFACSSRSTGVAVATSSCAVREACCPWSEDETARSLWAERSEELGAPGGSPAAFASGWVPEWSKDYPSLRCTMYRGALLVPMLARCGPTPMWVTSLREAAAPLLQHNPDPRHRPPLAVSHMRHVSGKATSLDARGPCIAILMLRVSVLARDRRHTTHDTRRRREHAAA